MSQEKIRRSWRLETFVKELPCHHLLFSLHDGQWPALPRIWFRDEGRTSRKRNELVLGAPSGEYNEAETTEIEEGLFVLGMSEAEKWSGGGILWNGGIIKCLLPEGDVGLGKWSAWLSIIAEKDGNVVLQDACNWQRNRRGSSRASEGARRCAVGVSSAAPASRG